MDLGWLATERRLAAFIEGWPDGVILLDRAGIVRYQNATVETLFGYVRKDSVGRSFTEVIHPDDRARVVSRFHEEMERPGGNRLAQLRILHTDGTWRHVEGHTLNLFSDPAVEGILVMIRDVTDRYEAQRLLTEGEARFRALATFTPVGIFSTSADGRLEFVNPALERLYGFAPGSELTVEDMAARVEPEDMPSLRQAIAHARASGAALRHQYRVRNAEGQIRWVSLGLASISDESSGFAGMVGMISDVTDRMHVENELQYLATHDSLTGLPNRSLLVDRLRQALSRLDRRDSGLAVMFLDLDGFKAVNDTFGHEAGDQVLVATALRLVDVVRSGDTVARLGGDEFVLLCDEVSGAEELEQIAARVTEAVNRAFALADGEVHISASIGIALAVGADDTVEALLRDADIALHHAKRRGKNCHEIFDEPMRRRSSSGLLAEDDLASAVESGRLALHWEPIVALDSGIVVGLEAAPRWRGAGRDELPGDEALGLAPPASLLSSFHAWILGDTARRVVVVPGTSPPAGALERRIHVNVGPRLLGHPRVVDLVRRALELAEIGAAQVVLEVSERLLTEQPPHLDARLEQLSALGVGLVDGEFGTGYASLARLRRFPVEGLKLSRTLIAGVARDVRQATTVRSLVDMAHSMGYTVGVTGVESYDQVVTLHTLGCDLAQGPYFADVLAPVERQGRVQPSGSSTSPSTVR